MTDKSSPAFPAICESVNGVRLQTGISIRDYFAGKALQGFTSNPEIFHWSAETFAKESYRAADSMLAERDKS